MSELPSAGGSSTHIVTCSKLAGFLCGWLDVAPLVQPLTVLLASNSLAAPTGTADRDVALKDAQTRATAVIENWRHAPKYEEAMLLGTLKAAKAQGRIGPPPPWKMRQFERVPPRVG